MTLRQALLERVLLGDGANGAWLVAQGYSRLPYDMACIDAPLQVLAGHVAYLEAGADFIETNTFHANRLRLGDAADQVCEINTAAVALARKAASQFEGRFILGAIGPCGKHIEPIGHVPRQEAFDSVAEQAAILAKEGVDGFLLETFVDLGELKVAVEAVKSVSDLPIIASKAFIEDGEALAEGLPTVCAREMTAMGVDAVGANCIVGPQRMLDLVRMMAEGTSLPILAFPTPGLPQLVKGVVVYDAAPEYFGKAAARLIEEGASIVGGCCGTLPDYIRALKQVSDGAKAKARPAASEKKASVAKEAPLETAPTELGEKLASGRFVTAIEMDVPRGLRLEKLLAGARKLKIAGADAINISDGARARLRMNPMAVAHLVQTQVGIEVTMHFSCRDRNLLAIQADLLGAHALGVHNILAVTGDPANVGDYPSATSVFDVDSIGLTRIMARFNEGIDLAGRPIGVKCGFTIGVAYNPLAMDQTLEDDRLRRKIDAGANVVYTQPIFEESLIESISKTCSALKIPVVIGVLPLRNARHCEFMHNEVPGISIPDGLRAQIAGAASDADALEIGLENAIGLSRKIRERAQGLYLMPPVGGTEIARRIIEGSALG